MSLDLFYMAEPVFMALVLFALWRAKEQKRFPVLFSYLAFRLVSDVLLIGFLHTWSFFHLSGTTAYTCYFYAFWSSYIAGAILVFFVLLELFRLAVQPLPALRNLGGIAFRWIACLSVLTALIVATSPHMLNSKLLIGIADQVMRCQSVFVLCLLLFMMITAGKLGLSYRSRIFGVCLGFGMIATCDLISVAVSYGMTHHVDIETSAVSIASTCATLVAMAVWAGYFLQREPERKAVTLPVTSPLMRWNDIATALGYSTGHIAQPASASPFFLQDVESVVDRVLAQNSLNIAS